MNSNLSPQFGSPEYLRQVTSGEHPPAMFATAREIVDTHRLGDMEHPVEKYDEETGEKGYHYFNTKQELLQHKVNEAPDLVDDIAYHGFDWNKEDMEHDPITLRNDTLVEGHHRTAAMYALRPDEFMPIHTRG
jgi:hypothetical protein